MSPWIAASFGLSGTSAGYGLSHIRSTAVATLVFSLYFPVLGLFQGARHGFAATMVATAALGFRVLSCYTLALVPALGYQMVWLNQYFGFAAGLLLTFLYLRSGRWARNVSGTDAPAASGIRGAGWPKRQYERCITGDETYDELREEDDIRAWCGEGMRQRRGQEVRPRGLPHGPDV